MTVNTPKPSRTEERHDDMVLDRLLLKTTSRGVRLKQFHNAVFITLRTTRGAGERESKYGLLDDPTPNLWRALRKNLGRITECDQPVQRIELQVGRSYDRPESTTP